MNLFFFSHLLLGHFITDYPLQTDQLFNAKIEKKLGVIIHGVLLFFVLIILVFPFILSPWVIAVCFLLAVLHIGQDQIKVSLTKRQKGENFFSFILDQGLHIFFIFLFSLTPLPEPVDFDSLLKKLFFSPEPAFFLTFLIAVTYFLWILLHSIEFTFLHTNNLSKGLLKYFGFLERGGTFVLFMINPVLSIAGLGFILFRVLFFKKKRLFEGIGGIIMAIGLAFLLRSIL